MHQAELNELSGMNCGSCCGDYSGRRLVRFYYSAQMIDLSGNEPAPTASSLQPKFSLGRVLATPVALERIPEEEIVAAIHRHHRGDWGVVCPEDAAANNEALTVGERLFSAYESSAGDRFWIITEADRSATTILLPEEY